MEVLHVSNAHFPAVIYGGPIFSVHYTCQALARRQVKVRVATTNANGSSQLMVATDQEVTFEPNYVVRYYKDSAKGRFSWAFTFNVWRDIRRATVVHLQDIFSPHAFETLLISAALRKPIVISPRGVLSSWALTNKRRRLKRLALSLFVRPFIGDARRVTWHATSVAEGEEIHSVFPCAAVTVVPNGIDCTAFRDGAHSLSRAQYLERFFPDCCVDAGQAKILVAMGRLHRKKSFDVAIAALAMVRRKFPEAVLLIAGGDGGELKGLRNMIVAGGLQGYASLTGEVHGDDKVAFLKGADLFLFPSHSENFGMVALEAMAAGLPLVASRNTPFEDIEAANCGRWVDNTPDAFAEAITEMFADDMPCRRQQARAHARRYDIDGVADQLQKTYEQLCSGNAG